jgi:polyhydroxybutyrate depolymerase
MRTEALLGLVAIAMSVGACGPNVPIGTQSGGAGTGAGAAGTTGVAGTTGAAGTNPDVAPASVNAVWRGAGCGKPLPADQPETVPGSPVGYKQYEVMGTGATLAGQLPSKAGPRTFWVRVPYGYDPNHAYRVVYLGQGCGGYKIANTNTFPLFNESLMGSEQAIYVAIDIPENMANMDCYDQRDGKASQEWEAFELFHEVVDANYCVDNNRVFVAGYRTGGALADMWGCYFAGDGQKPGQAPRRFAPRYHIRGQFAVAGGEPTEQPDCGGPVAALFLHDQNDNVTPISSQIAALQRVGRMNGCSTVYEDATIQEPWHPELPLLTDLCKRFTGCPKDYPVVFCTTIGLGRSDQKDRATLAFTRFVSELPTAP